MRRRRASRCREQRPEGSPLARRAELGERDPAPVAGELLRLQRSGGNEAVRTMLAQRSEVEDAAEAAGSEGAGADQAQVEETDVAGNGPGEDLVGAPGGSTLVMDDPIGTLSLISSSQTDATGRNFDVTVASSDRDALLLAAFASQRSFATVTISPPGGTVLKNVVINALNTGPGATSSITMSLNSSPTGPSPGGAAGTTLVVDAPIGPLPLISSSRQGASAFNVVVASSSKDPLLFLAAATGRSIGTVKLPAGGGVVVLQNV